MPRIARIIAPGYPHHITQRGNNRATVFFDDEDRQTYLKLLGGYARKHAVQIWAYCLMDNHVHLLAIPETETALARGIGLTNQGKLGTLPTFRLPQPFARDSIPPCQELPGSSPPAIRTISLSAATTALRSFPMTKTDRPS